MEKYTFVVYSKEGCPACANLKQLLSLAKVEHVIYTLGEHFATDDFYYEFGKNATFPQVLCNNEKIGGLKESAIFLKGKI
jgi:glutaredoxin